MIFIISGIFIAIVCGVFMLDDRLTKIINVLKELNEHTNPRRS